MDYLTILRFYYLAVHAYEQVHLAIKQKGIIVTHMQHGYSILNKDLVSPHLIIGYCHQGSSRVLYDMCEFTFSKNVLAVVMPQHVLCQLDCTDDFVFTRMVISAELFADIRANVFSHDYNKFYLSPICKLTDEQAKQLLAITGLLAEISEYDTTDLQLRRQMLLAQLSVGYELLNYYRREQDQQIKYGAYSDLFDRFCKLVVEHYCESREVKFYADLLHLTPKHFSKVIRQETGGLSPADWIEQYVVAQAKQLIEIYPTRTLGQIAFMLGFSEPSSFYRYFKRVSGITARQYRESLKTPTVNYV